MDGKKFLDGNACSCALKEAYFSKWMWTIWKCENEERRTTRNTCVAKLLKEVDLEKPTSLLDLVHFGVHAAWMWAEPKDYSGEQEHVRIFDLSRCDPTVSWLRDLTLTLPHGLMKKKDLRRNAWEGTANWQTRQTSKCTKSPHQVLMIITSKERIRNQGWIINGVYAHRPEVLVLSSHRQAWHCMVCKLPHKSFHQMNKACGKRLARLNSYVRVTSSYRQYSHAGNAASECRLGLFQDADFSGDLADSKSTSAGVLVHLLEATHLCRLADQLVLWKKQTAVSHSSTEAEIIPLDAGLR